MKILKFKFNYTQRFSATERNQIYSFCLVYIIGHLEWNSAPLLGFTCVRFSIISS